MVSEVSPVNQNTVRPRVVTPTGMVKAVSFLQSWKAALPMLVRAGVPAKVIVVKLLQPENELSPMVSTLSGTTKDVSDEHELNALEPIAFSDAVPANVTDSRALLMNAPEPSEVILSGMVMPVIFA